MTRQHNFKKLFTSGITTWEYWKCTRCDQSAESHWNDKTNERERWKINGPEECTHYSVFIYPFVLIRWLVLKIFKKKNDSIETKDDMEE